MKRRIIGFIGVFLLLLIGIYVVYRQQNTKNVLCNRCSVVYVDVDILRADELPCYGYTRNTMPNLCAFASKGTIFKQNYSQSNNHIESLFSDLTSLYPWSHRVSTEFTDSLSRNIPTMAELFRMRGYRTAYYGVRLFNNITSYNGGERGYDRFYNYPDDRLQILSDLLNKNKPFFLHISSDSFHWPYLQWDYSDIMEPDMPKPPGLPITRHEFDVALGAYLKKNYKNIFSEKTIKENPDMFTGTPDANLRLATFYKAARQTYDGQHVQLLRTYGIPDATYMQFIDIHNPAQVAYIRMLYDSVIRQMDDSYAKLWTVLASDKKAKNVVVVIGARMGEAFAEHGTMSHDGDPYSEIYHTPLIVYVPGQKPGSTNIVSENIDILPTLLDIVGLPPSKLAQGQSLVPVIRQQPAGHRYAVGEVNNSDELTIQDDKWMLLSASYSGRLELYDKYSDPTEQINLVGEPQYKSQEDSMLSALNNVHSQTTLPR